MRGPLARPGDTAWLAAVAKRGWVVLTKDQRLRYRPTELAALRRGGVRVFILTAGNLTGADIAKAFVAALPHMARLLREAAGPFVARVRRGGSVHLG